MKPTGLLLAALLLAAPMPAQAGWSKVSSDYAGNTTIPALAPDGADTIVAWRLETSPSTQEIDAQRFASTLEASYRPLGPRPVSYAGCSGLGNPARFPAPAGLQLVVEGRRSVSSG